MFYVAGYPVKLFKDNVTAQEGLSLNSHIGQECYRILSVGQIPQNTYAFQPDEVATIAVKAVLISYDFRTTHCDSVGSFAKIVYEIWTGSKKNGHPKWNQVDLNYALKGWEQYDLRPEIHRQEK